MHLDKVQDTKSYYEDYPFPEGGAKRIKWWQDYLTPFLPDHIIRGKLVGDLGAGVGEMTRGLINRGARMKCLDLTLSALKRNRQINPEAEHFNGSVLNLPFADEAFDHTICLGVLMVTPDIRQGIKEVARVTAPGGTAVLYVYSYWSILNLAYSVLRPVTKHIPLESVPRGIVMLLQPFAMNHFNMKMDEPQLRRLLGDKLWTPHCTFHKMGEIKKWCEEEGLSMTMRKIFYMGYANVMAFRKNGVPRTEPVEDVALRCPKCGHFPIPKSNNVCRCGSCGAEYRKEEGIYRFLDPELH